MMFDAWFTRYRLLVIALLGTLIFHGALLFAGSYRETYDAFVHIFLADHYARSWWNLWEPRWYTGFTMISYPPLTHQLTAILSWFTSLPTGFIIVTLFSTVFTTLGVYRFSRLWVPHRPALYAALLTMMSSSVAETVHVFGQLPTIFVMGVMLNALPYIWRWVDEANVSDLFRGCALLMVAAAGHHVTTLFGMVFFCSPILATLLLRKLRTPRTNEAEVASQISSRQMGFLLKRSYDRVAPAFVRCGIFGVGLFIILVVTVLPYWLWSRSDPITQITIPHGSRDNFLANIPVGLIFFVIPWGVLLVILPYALYKGFGTANWLLASSLAVLTILGTGGTTPIPAFLLRGSFYVLTLDRFTFWATIIVLPFGGLFIESLLHGRLGRWITNHFGGIWRTVVIGGLVMAMIVFALFTANITQYRRFQPDPLDMTPIVEFLVKDNHDNWRYLTLGFGDQMAWLSTQTDALNVEGNYHSARRLPELTSTPVERLDGAKFTSIPGLGSLGAFLTNPHQYNLKYVFVNDDFYEPLLYFTGWHSLGLLDNDVQVWERSDVPPLPAAIPAQVYPGWQRLMWGTLPIGSLFITAVVFFLSSLRFPFTLMHKPVIKDIVRSRFIQFILTAERQEPQPSSEDWQLWKKLWRRIFHSTGITPRLLRLVYISVGLASFLTIWFVAANTYREQVNSPENVILSYYDALDFKHYSTSYNYLDTDLTREEYLRWLSLRGGILSSFAKLENLHMKVKYHSKSQADAFVSTDWLTALGSYTIDDEWKLQKVNGDWRLVLDVATPPNPREILVSTADVDFYIDLPLNTLDATALTRSVLDRALLSVSPIAVTYMPEVPIGFEPEAYDAGRIEGRFEGLISVVGAVTNHSPAPVHVTITAILRDADDKRLAEMNVMDLMLHQLWSEETTPFRVDFAGAAASEILDLDMIDSVEIIAKGIPTSFNLDRSLIMIEPNLLYNAGLELVDIPRILTTFTDDKGTPLWVESTYLERAIAPDETLAFSLPDAPTDLQILDVPVMVDGPRLIEWSSTIPEIIVHGYSR